MAELDEEDEEQINGDFSIVEDPVVIRFVISLRFWLKRYSAQRDLEKALESTDCEVVEQTISRANELGINTHTAQKVGLLPCV